MALVSTAERRITGSALRGPCEGGSEEDSRADISYGEVLSLDDYRDKPLEPDYGTYEAYELFTGTARYSTSREDALAYIGVGVIVALLLCVIYASVVAIF